MRAQGRVLSLVSGLVLLAVACRRGPHPLATIGGRPVTLTDLGETVSAQTGKSLAEASPELIAAVFESRLEEDVLLAASDDSQDRELPVAARGGRARELLAVLCPPPPQPSDAEVEAALRERPAVVTSERLRVRQLVLPDETTARQARERIRRGEDFLTLSRELSRAPNAADGGVVGWVERGQLPPEFEVAVFGLAPGVPSQPVQSNAGWHVFQVTDRVEPGAVDTEARARVRAERAAAAAEQARDACIRRLATKVGVTVDCTDAPFPCHNPFEGQP